VSDLPSYQQLLDRDDAPAGSSWGLWGERDVLGSLNLLTEERARRGAGLVRRGAVFNLNLAFLDPGDATLAADPGYPVYTSGPLLRSSWWWMAFSAFSALGATRTLAM